MLIDLIIILVNLRQQRGLIVSLDVPVAEAHECLPQSLLFFFFGISYLLNHFLALVWLSCPSPLNISPWICSIGIHLQVVVRTVSYVVGGAMTVSMVFRIKDCCSV